MNFYMETLQYLAQEYAYEAVVITGGYDENIDDFFNDSYSNDELPECELDIMKGYFEQDGIKVPATQVYRVDDHGYVESIPEFTVVAFEDYEKLGRS